jgi:hypothetical protein
MRSMESRFKRRGRHKAMFKILRKEELTGNLRDKRMTYSLQLTAYSFSERRSDNER